MRPEDYFQQPYARLLLPDPAGGYAAEILEFPGCYAEGETPDEALAALDRAALAWIDAAQAQDQEIPPPVGHYDYTGRVALRAVYEGVSLNTWLVAAIARAIGMWDVPAPVIEELTPEG